MSARNLKRAPEVMPPMNPAVVAVSASVIRSLNARKKASSIDLGLGEPTLKPDMPSFERAMRWVAEHGCRYTAANAGDPELREAIAKHYRYPGVPGAANVCITTGSQEALYVVIKTLFDPAEDELLLVEPAFPAYEKMARIEGLRCRRVSMREETGFAFDPELIVKALSPRTRAILVCSPCNPTGRVISSGDVRRIAKLLGERSGPPVYVIHDEIYRELRYVDDVGCFGEHYPYTIAINSLSKSNALTGLRIGWLMAPSEVMGELVKMHAMLTSCASTFGQRVAYEIFAADGLGVHRGWYARSRESAVAAAREAGLPLVEPDGAFYLCVKTGASDDVAFAHALLDERDVVAIPGSIFGESLRGWLRLSFVGDAEAFREGCTRIA
jgi:aminotransferase